MTTFLVVLNKKWNYTSKLIAVHQYFVWFFDVFIS